MLHDALKYLERGYSVIPVKRDKRPLLPWAEYQTRRPTKEEVCSWWEAYPQANVGIVTGEISGIVVIDIDTQEGLQNMEQLLPSESWETPTVVTPSGGLHLYYKINGHQLGNNTRVIPGCDLRATGGYVLAPGSISIDGINYNWRKSLDIEMRKLPDEYVKAIKQNTVIEKVRIPSSSIEYFEHGRRDEDLFTVANALTKSDVSKDLIRNVLNRLAFSWGESNPRWIDDKVISASKRSEKYGEALKREVRDFVDLSTGTFSIKDVYEATGITDRERRKYISNVLASMIKDKVLEKTGSRNGEFKKIIADCEEIKFMEATTETADIILPVGLHELCYLMPGEIVAVAGTPNSGKTAFVLNIIRLNQDHWPIHYYSSEMGASALRDRLEKFGYPLDSWNFTAYDRSSDFGSVIVPDALNIIDFLEYGDEFYKAGLFFRQIHEHLGNGIAIVAIQRDPGKSVGVGGFRTLEKPRLYLNMSHGCIKIVKGKNWVNPDKNPNNLERRFQLTNGCHFDPDGDWYFSAS